MYFGRALSAALVAAVIGWCGAARAQTCPSGTLLCAAGWCCPYGTGGSTQVCCNSNPQSSGCTSNGICSSGTGGSGGSGGGGGSGCPSSAPLYCAAGWCCPYGSGGSTQVCCNSNPQSSGCSYNGSCGGSGTGGTGGSGGGGGYIAPSGCGSSATFDVINCGSGWCPANSTCAANGNCACDSGYVAVDCSGNLCNGACSGPNYACVSSAGAVGSGGSGGSGGYVPPSGCGSSTTFDVVNCGSGWCPANSTCAANGSCSCAAGYVAVDCSGNLCNGGCSGPNYACVPQGGSGGSGGTPYGFGGSGGGGGTTTTPKSHSGCDVSPGSGDGAGGGAGAGALALVGLCVAIALVRRRGLAALAVLALAGTLAACSGDGSVAALPNLAHTIDPANAAHLAVAPARDERNQPEAVNMCLPGVDPVGVGTISAGISPR